MSIKIKQIQTVEISMSDLAKAIAHSDNYSQADFFNLLGLEFNEMSFGSNQIAMLTERLNDHGKKFARDLINHINHEDL